VPYSAPRSDEFYYVLLSAWTDTGSYVQIGFSDDYGTWGLTYSWTSGSTYHYSPNAMALSEGSTYTFYITTQNGYTYFTAYQGLTYVWSLVAPTGGNYLYLHYLNNGAYGYTNYEEVWQTSLPGGSPAFDFYFFGNYWVSLSGQTDPYISWWTFSSNAPSDVAVTISGNCVLVDNPMSTILFKTNPALLGATITFAGSVYNTGQSAAFSGTYYAALANAPSGYTFDHWEYSGDYGSGVSVPNTMNNPTTVQVRGEGWLEAVLVVVSSPQQDWWPMFHHDLMHIGYSTSTAPNTNTLLWNYTTGGGMFSSPAVAGGLVYVGSDKVYCVNATSGAFVWSYTTSDMVYSSPAVSGGKVYVGSFDGNVYCLNASTGAKLWSYTTGNWVYSSPAVAGGLVYIGSCNNKVYALNAATGALIWSYTTGTAVESSPAVAGGVVYVGSDKVYALNAATGALIWSYLTGRWMDSSPAVAGGIVYVGSEKVYALNATTGAFVWSYATGSVDSSPAVAGGIVYIGSYDNNVYAFGRLPLSVSISPSSVFTYVSQPQLFSSNVAGGISPYTYQWYLDGAPVSGAINPTWAFIPTSVSSYTVSLVVNDSATPPTSAQSNNASVTALSAKIYIMSDGSIVPSYAPISTLDNVTYTFTGNASYPTYEGIVVERSSIAIDGNGYTVQGNQSGDTGLILTGVSNVTIKNTNIKGFQNGIYLSSSNSNIINGNNATANGQFGIYLYSSSSNTVSGNNATANTYGIFLFSSDNNTVNGNNVAANIGVGIFLDSSSNNTVSANKATANNNGIDLFSSSNNNTVSGNNATANGFGICLVSSSDNIISGNNATANSADGICLGYSSWIIITANNIANNSNGLYLDSSSNCSIATNNITANSYGVDLYSSSNNSIYHNNFIANNVQVSIGSASLDNAWDDGYPSGGNYWSNSSPVDLYNGPAQNETGSDGISDSPYAIDSNNTDNYPLVKFYGSHDVGATVLNLSKTIVGKGYCLNSSLTVVNYSEETETFNTTLLANGTDVQTQSFSLLTRNSTEIPFVWNTTDFVYGNYTMSAYASPAPGEIDVTDNNCTSNIPVHVGVPGDVSSTTPGVYDGVTNMKDIAYMVMLFNTRPSSSNWNPNADVDNDAVCNMRDIAIAVIYFNQHE
jgi:parallel beta-helix repeat protein